MTTKPRIHENLHMVRLDDETERRLKDKSQRDGIAPAVLCRAAVREFLRRDEAALRDDPTKDIRFSTTG